MALLMAEPLDRPATLFREDGRVVGGGPTLDDAVVGAWEGLTAHVAIACPVCGGAMRPRPDGGRCEDCGASLS